MLRLTVDPSVPGRLIGISQDPAASARLSQHPEWSLLAPSPIPADAAAGPACIVTWTGSLAQVDGGGLFDADPRTWGPRGWAALESACDAAVRGTEAVYLIRPHARHVVSDVPGIRRFATTIAQRHPGRFGLLLDPGSMLDVAHLERRTAVDSLRRIAEEMGTLDAPECRLVGVVVANVRRAGGGLELATIVSGELDPTVITRLFGGI